MPGIFLAAFCLGMKLKWRDGLHEAPRLDKIRQINLTQGQARLSNCPRILHLDHRRRPSTTTGEARSFVSMRPHATMEMAIGIGQLVEELGSTTAVQTRHRTTKKELEDVHTTTRPDTTLHE